MSNFKLDVEIFLDGADAIIQHAKDPVISGFTTNPTLMRKAGVLDYCVFAIEAAARVAPKPLSVEVLSDDFEEMFIQAINISKLGPNINVKIPITNTKGESSLPLIKRLIEEGIVVNVTAITLIRQICELLPVMRQAKEGFISIFAGRIADTGTDPVPIMEKAIYLIKDECPQIKVIWASCREIYNVRQANSVGCDIITIGSDLFKKLSLLGTDLKEMSLNTVKMFYEDGKGFYIR